MRFLFLMLLIITFVSCIYRREPTEVLTSPSGKYNLKIDFNHSNEDKKKYECIILTLLDKNFHQIAVLQTGASHLQKWAIAWYPNKDTIIMNSGDIGIYAYHLRNDNQLDTIRMTKDIDSIANIIFQKKYRNQ